MSVATHLFMPLAILAISALVLVYSICQFAHVRVLTADLKELERLQEDGVIGSLDAVRDFNTLSELLSDIAPAVYMRQEIWIRLYFQALRLARGISHSSKAVESEIWRLTAYQAAHYRVARTRLAAIRAR